MISPIICINLQLENDKQHRYRKDIGVVLKIKTRIITNIIDR